MNAPDFVRGRGAAAFGTRLRRLSERIDREVQDLYVSYGVDFEPRWFPVFAALEELGPLSVGDLATRIGVSHAAISQIRGMLVERGLVRACTDAADQRRQILALSRRGRAAARRMRPLWEAIAEATSNVCAEGAPRLLAELGGLEEALKRESLSARVLAMLGRVPSRRKDESRRSKMSLKKSVVLGILALALVENPARAAAPPVLTADEARGAVDEVIRLVGADYVFPEKRAAITGALQAARAAHRYDTANPGELGERLTADLREASHDRHLYVVYDPDRYRDLLQHQDEDSGRSAYVREAGRRRNQGFEELRILEGNIRYVKVTQFAWSNDLTGRVIDEAARFLADGDAVIVDLRGNGGGSASSVARLISYFLDADDRMLMTFHDGLSGETSATRVCNDLPAPRMVGRPLYVLIDEGTGSAAEEFTYHVQQFKLGVLVGQTTAGAANNNALFPVAPAFFASVSVGRPVHPVSGINWEGTGIPPDVRTPSASALDQARVLALRKLMEGAGEAERSRYEWPLAGLEARLQPVQLSGADLAAYVGRYGIRTVRLEKGALVYQRESRDPVGLIPMGGDLFAFADAGEVRVRFRRAGGKVVGFDQVTSDGQILPSERSGS